MALHTSQLEIPDSILDPWLGKVQHGSVVAALSNSIPMKFGKGHYMTFDIGEAEFVEEGANKSGSVITPKIVRTAPFKFQKTVRWTNEVMYADEDMQLSVVKQVLDLIQPALSRALDYGVIHGVNPATGDTVASMTQRLAAATSIVEASDAAKPYLALDGADALVLANGYTPASVALAPAYAGLFASLRATQTEARLYPSLKLATDPSELDGHTASVSKTVAAGAGDIKAIVGDFNAIRWGIQRAIGLELIEHGDPDGGGDLKRNNQVAYRAEVVYGWGIADLNAFALIKNAA